MKKCSLSIISVLCFLNSVSYAADFYEEPLPEVEALPIERFQEGASHPSNHQETNLLQWFKKMDLLQQEIQDLRGRLEEQKYELDQLKKRSESEISALTKQVEQLGGAKLKTNDANSSFTFEAPKASKSDSFDFDPANGPPPEEKLYQESYLKLQYKDYLAAEKGFLSLIKQFPRGKYAPNAYYWLGEVHVLNQEISQAEEVFNSLINQFPAHPKTGDALLKLGLLAYDKHDLVKARSYFQRVQAEFPNGSSARLAQYRLNQMETKG